MTRCMVTSALFPLAEGEKRIFWVFFSKMIDRRVFVLLFQVFFSISFYNLPPANCSVDLRRFSRHVYLFCRAFQMQILIVCPVLIKQGELKANCASSCSPLGPHFGNVS